jgi:uncharacterized membrane protein YbhN (UPF0104 family)
MTFWLQPCAAPWVRCARDPLSCVGFVLTFQMVFPYISRRLAARIAWSEMAFGAVVPLGGAGGMSVGAWILHTKEVPLRLVVIRSGVLFLLTTAINVLVLALAGVGLGIGLLAGPHPATLGLVPAAVALAGLAVFGSADIWGCRLPGQGRLATWTSSIADAVRMTRGSLLSWDWRLAGAVGYLLFDIAVLWACFRAFGANPPLAGLVLGYQIGYLANLIPLPGSIGALEGGLAGALLLYGTPPGPTLAAVIIYHAIALWLPTIGGTIAFATLRGALQPLPAHVMKRILRNARRTLSPRSLPS